MSVCSGVSRRQDVACCVLPVWRIALLAACRISGALVLSFMNVMKLARSVLGGHAAMQRGECGWW